MTYDSEYVTITQFIKCFAVGKKSYAEMSVPRFFGFNEVLKMKGELR